MILINSPGFEKFTTNEWRRHGWWNRAENFTNFSVVGLLSNDGYNWWI